jgi:hypothetical protein
VLSVIRSSRIVHLAGKYICRDKRTIIYLTVTGERKSPPDITSTASFLGNEKKPFVQLILENQTETKQQPHHKGKIIWHIH